MPRIGQPTNRGLSDSRYVLLLGRSGGQTVIGGTGSGENLTLQSTSHATRGKIVFGASAYDEVNNRLGIGEQSPAYTVDVVGAGGALDGVMRFSNTSTDATNKSGGIIVRHYTNTEEPISLAVVTSQSAVTIFALGGGNALLNTITEFRVYTASTNTTLTGSLALVVDSAQNVGIGIAAPLARLHVKRATEGATVSRFETTGSTTTVRDDLVQHDGLTSNATLTTIATIATTTNIDSTVETKVVARQIGGAAGTVGHGAGYHFFSTFSNIAGTVSQIGATTYYATHEDNAAWTAQHAVSGTDVLIQVQGEASKNILWVSTSKINVV